MIMQVDPTNTAVCSVGGLSNVQIGDTQSFTFTFNGEGGMLCLQDSTTADAALMFVDYSTADGVEIADPTSMLTVGSTDNSNWNVTCPANSAVVTVTNNSNQTRGMRMLWFGSIISATAVV